MGKLVEPDDVQFEETDMQPDPLIIPEAPAGMSVYFETTMITPPLIRQKLL